MLDQTQENMTDEARSLARLEYFLSYGDNSEAGAYITVMCLISETEAVNVVWDVTTSNNGLLVICETKQFCPGVEITLTVHNSFAGKPEEYVLNMWSKRLISTRIYQMIGDDLVRLYAAIKDTTEQRNAKKIEAILTKWDKRANAVSSKTTHNS